MWKFRTLRCKLKRNCKYYIITIFWEKIVFEIRFFHNIECIQFSNRLLSLLKSIRWSSKELYNEVSLAHCRTLCDVIDKDREICNLISKQRYNISRTNTNSSLTWRRNNIYELHCF